MSTTQSQLEQPGEVLKRQHWPEIHIIYLITIEYIKIVTTLLA